MLYFVFQFKSRFPCSGKLSLVTKCRNSSTQNIVLGCPSHKLACAYYASFQEECRPISLSILSNWYLSPATNPRYCHHQKPRRSVPEKSMFALSSTDEDSFNKRVQIVKNLLFRGRTTLVFKIASAVALVPDFSRNNVEYCFLKE